MPTKTRSIISRVEKFHLKPFDCAAGDAAGGEVLAEGDVSARTRRSMAWVGWGWAAALAPSSALVAAVKVDPLGSEKEARSLCSGGTFRPNLNGDRENVKGLVRKESETVENGRNATLLRLEQRSNA